MNWLKLAETSYHALRFTDALKYLVPADPSAERSVLLVKIMIEKDKGAAAFASAKGQLERFPKSGELAYWAGVAAYAAGEDFGEIERHFKKAVNLKYEGAHLGIGFLFFCQDRVNEARLHLARRIDDNVEMEHIRLLMMAQVCIKAKRFVCAEDALMAARALLREKASLLRLQWGELCEGRLFRAKGEFFKADFILRKLEMVTAADTTPRLARNIEEAKKHVETKSVQDAVRLPEDSAVVQNARRNGITKKPMLMSLFHYLYQSGDDGANKEQIVTNVWGERYNPMVHDERIYKAIHRLRGIIGDHHGYPQFLVQKGQQYVLWMH